MLKECLKLIPEACAGLSYELIVIDNGSTDGSREMLGRDFPAVKLAANEENLGFPKAVNQGIGLSRGNFLALINTDVLIPPGALFKLVLYLKENREVAAVAPQLVGDEGSLQRSGGFKPTPRAAFKHIIPGSCGITVRSSAASGAVEVDWLCMACLVLRREAVAGSGMLDDSHFMYAEDLEYGLRLKKAGWRLRLLPGVRVKHHTFGSSSGRPEAHLLGLTAYFRVAAGELSPSKYALFGLLLSLAYATRYVFLRLGGIYSRAAASRAPLLGLYARTALKIALHRPAYAERMSWKLEKEIKGLSGSKGG